MASIPSERITVGGWSCCPTREVITIYIICFIYYFLFYANPLPSSIPPPLNLHNRQVDDCIADDEEILIKGGQVDVLAEELEEDVGVVLSAGVVCIHNRQVDDCVADDEEILIEGGQVDVLAEEVEEDVGVDLSAGVVCKKYGSHQKN